MVERYRPKSVAEPRRGGDYFKKASSAPRQFITTGCTLLDCILCGPPQPGQPSGGWVLGRMANIVGDKSTGKTLLAIEACANFARQYPKGRIWYREAEAAFDTEYAESVGLPLSRVDFGKDGPDTAWDTVEDIFEDLEAVLTKAEKSGHPGLYIVDSLDALSSRALLERGTKQGFNLEKPKIISNMFQQLVRRVKKTSIALLIVSQVRDNIGVVFGDKHTRSGGHAMDFYASHVLWLSHLANLTQEHGKQKRVVGVRIKAKVKKNKIWNPHRIADFVIRFGYGVDDFNSNLEFLKAVGATEYVDLFAQRAQVKTDGVALDKLVQRARDLTIQYFAEVEEKFKPPRKKYETGSAVVANDAEEALEG